VIVALLYSVVSVGVKVAVIRVVPPDTTVTVAPAIVAVAVVADVYVNAPLREPATVGAVRVKAGAPLALETLVKNERVGVALAFTVNVNVCVALPEELVAVIV
jgi:hypothetical protein